MNDQRAVFRCASAFLLVSVLGAAGFVKGDDSVFPFVVSYESVDSVTSLASWPDKPAGKQGFIRADHGKFFNDAGPIRFWGTNLCFEACFPSHAEAQKLAERLARFGINVVRMHHMDARSIWGNSGTKTTIDPKQLEKLDYLIWQLKQNGVYTNLNLHVSRSLGAADGFPAEDRRPKYDKGLDNFEPRMIALQKKYARDLLTHVNPYTRLSYCNDPAIAFVEINNENALCDQWSRGKLDDLPEPYATTFRKLWSKWLKQKYGSTDRLRAAWAVGAQPLGSELLTNGDFEQPLSREWNLERDPQTDVAWQVIRADLANITKCLRADVRRQGREPWRPQFSQAGITVKKGSAYTLSFWIRSDADRTIGVNCMMAHEPWERLGLSTNVRAGAAWKHVSVTFVADRNDADARVTFTGLKPGTYQFAGVSLRPGGIAGLKRNETLEVANVAVLKRGDLNRTAAARRDFIDFMWDTEDKYWTGMYQYLKEELQVHALVSGTQLNYSPVRIQSKLDYIDAHAYWQHPRFPNRPWDRNDWYIENVAMVNQRGGTLTSLAARRVAGRPFTVSEYNHPAPNSYAAEGLPMLAAMAAMQDWGAVYSFTYSHDTDFEPKHITNYFDIKGDPAKLIHMPAAVAMFVRGDLAPSRATMRVPLSLASERAKLYETGDPWRLAASEFGVNVDTLLSHRVAFDLSAKTLQRDERDEPPAMQWIVPEAGRGRFTVSTARAKFFTGFTQHESIALGDVTLRVGPTRLGWATVSMTCLDGAGFDDSGRLLIAASGWMQNSNAQLESLGGDRVTLRSHWGQSPLLCEGVRAEVVLPVEAKRVQCFALDQSGNTRAAVPVSQTKHGTLLQLGPKYRTLWYQVTIDEQHRR